ncbi:uncharacterized protein EV422DRAFT_484644, partial [Fimicolochytrium jonesii]|uniref:uncharacterized protein n=1 Tax=Fimicolochytrium jonesii TaxID=1396493 RepID=UPI0022FF24F9
EELKILARIESRFAFLPNPRFHIKRRFMKRTASETREISVFKPPGIDRKWLSKERSQCLVAAGSKAAEDGRHMTDSPILSMPATVFFTDYAPGNVYEKEVIIKNVSSQSRRFRLSAPPPYTRSPVFAISLISAPADHGINGLVAPGMSLRYRVSFKPTSLATCRESFIVSTETGNIFTIPFIAQREPPSLTLPGILDFGPSRAGFANLRVWEVKNEGGPGRFLIVPEHVKVDPFTVFDAMGDMEKYGSTTSSLFEIFPTFLCLKKGETCQLIVRYSPPGLNPEEFPQGRSDESLFKLVCDNCIVTDMPLRGMAQNPRLKVKKIECADEVIEAEGATIGNLLNYDAYIPFGAQNLQATTTYSVTIHNESMIRLPYSWDVFDVPPDKMSASDLLHGNSEFQVIPSRGWLAPHEDTVFKIAFTPETFKCFDVVCALHLLHSDRRKTVSPKSSQDARKRSYGSALWLRCTSQSVPFRVHITPEILQVPDTLFTGSTYTADFHITNESASPITFSWEVEDVNENTMHIGVSPASGVLNAAACAKAKMQFIGLFPGTVKGTLACKIANGPTVRIPVIAEVALAPGALNFALPVVDFGLMRLGSSKKIDVPLVSRAPIPLQWRARVYRHSPEKKQNDCYMSYEPSQGLLAPNSTQIISMTCVPTWYQDLRAVLECVVVDDGEPIVPLSVERNFSAATSKTQPVAESFSGRSVAVGAVEIRAQAQTPKAKILCPHNALSGFVGVPCEYQVTIENESLLAAGFKWIGLQSSECSVSFEPQTGCIPGGQSVDIKVRVVAHIVGELNKTFACQIDGMVESDGVVEITMDLEVFGINLTFHIQSSEPVLAAVSEDALGSLSFDFGMDCPIFAERHSTLTIHNRSAISAPFQVAVQKYRATNPPEGPLGQQDGDGRSLKSGVGQATGQLSGSNPLLPLSYDEPLGFSSKTGVQYISEIKEVRRLIKRMDELLREGRGAAFHSSPTNGTIGPWGTVQIRVTSYNNLVGLYEDNLMCDVRGWPSLSIPIRLGVVGLPVRFFGAHLVAKPKNSVDVLPRVNFGTRLNSLTFGSTDGVRLYPYPRSDMTDDQMQELIDTEAYSKVINIENQTPRDMKFSWILYIKHTPGGTGVSPSIEEIISPENRLDPDQLSTFGVYPATLVLPAFRSTSIRIFFRSATVGASDCLLVADVGYIQKGGAPLYGHGRKESTRYPATDSSFPASYLKSMACVHIQGRAIE